MIRRNITHRRRLVPDNPQLGNCFNRLITEFLRLDMLICNRVGKECSHATYHHQFWMDHCYDIGDRK